MHHLDCGRQRRNASTVGAVACLLTFLAVILALATGCARQPGLEPRESVVAVVTAEGETTVLQTTPPSDAGTAEAAPKLTDIVDQILSEDGWDGRQVTLVGYYRGWDLLHEAQEGPPVTRSDWVIKDNSGAIYVVQNQTEIEGQDRLSGDDRLIPSSRAAVTHIVRVSGLVRTTANGQPYVEATRIELVE